jgi:hypothetical protein
MSDAQPRCRITFENWGYSAAEEADLRSDPSPDALWREITELADILTSRVDRPDDVTLVIACDLAKAVRDREGGSYTMARGSSGVAARTMPRDNGRKVDIIVHGYYLVGKNPAGLPRFTATGYPRFNPEARRLRRAIAHEAQHANMELAGSGFRAYRLQDISGGAKRLQFEVARKMCDEHRAERNTIGTYGSHPPTVKDVLDILGHMGEQLADAFTRFEQSANREQLRTDVYNACAPVWTWVAYWTAEYRDADGLGPVPDNIAQVKL